MKCLYVYEFLSLWNRVHDFSCRDDRCINAKTYIYDSDLYLNTRNLKNERLKPIFEYKITFWICNLVLWIHKSYCVLKKLVWNVCIKAFWYINNIANYSVIKLTKTLVVWIINFYYFPIISKGKVNQTIGWKLVHIPKKLEKTFEFSFKNHLVSYFFYAKFFQYILLTSN